MVNKLRMKRIITILFALIVASFLLIINAVAAQTQTALDGKLVISHNGSKTITVSGTTVKIEAQSGTGALITAETIVISIKNDTTSSAKISFDYSVDAKSFSIDNTPISLSSNKASGSYNIVLAPGGTLSIGMAGKTTFLASNAVLTLSNLTYEQQTASYQTTFKFDSGKGSISVDGMGTTNGAQKSISMSTGATLSATPAEGYVFVGWMNESDNRLFSTNASFTFVPETATTVCAVFATDNGAPYFMVGSAETFTYKETYMVVTVAIEYQYYTVSGKYLYDDFSKAMTAANQSTNKYVVLMNNAELSEGEYTVPAGVTLLIPFDDSNTLYATAAQATSSYSTPTRYRTLKMASGAKITVNGAISLSAKHRYTTANSNGSTPTGNVSFIEMEKDSSITINSGGALYAYGFITGEGSVTANSGASVYELFQMMDFRGGTQSMQMSNGVFPLSQYYVQNIEVPVTYYSGAIETCYATVYMSNTQFGSGVSFIGKSACMFNLTSGYLTKRYDGSKDRLIVEVHGTLSASSIALAVGNVSINSENYELPINGNLTIDIASGQTTIAQDMAFLPGAELIIRENATLKINSNNNIYVYDSEQWGKYCNSVATTFRSVAYAPGKKITRTDADLKDAVILVNGTLDATEGYLYTTSSGANIYSTGFGIVKITAGTQKQTYQYNQTADEYTAIAITPAKLKNGSSTYEPYVTTANRGTIAITYRYANDGWYSLAVNPTEANTDHTDITVAFRVKDYLWMNGHCYFGLVDAEEVMTDLVTANISVQTFNTETTSWEDVTGYVDAVVINGAVYLVKKVPSNEIPKDITFRLVYTNKDGETTTSQYLSVPITVNFMTYADAYIEANKNADADDVRADGVKVVDMVALLEAMKNYGAASEKYFEPGKEANAPTELPPNMTTKLDELTSGAPESVPNSKGELNDVSISTQGVLFNFNERISMTMKFALKGGDWSKLANGGAITQIGLLVGDANDGVLMGTSGGYDNAYLLYSASKLVGENGSVPTLPVDDIFATGQDQTADWDAIKDLEQWSITFDLASAEYSTEFALRLFVVVDNDSVLYGTQYHYGLADYIVRTYGMTPPTGYDTNAYKHLMVATWNYMEAADAAFNGVKQ